MDAKVDWTGEPETPRWLEWRLAIYPLALTVGASALVTPAMVAIPLFILFALLMFAPIAIKWRAWGGFGLAIRWIFTSNVKIRREGFLFVGFVIVFGIAAINTGTNLLYLILAMLISIMIMSSVLANLNLRGLRISRRMPGYVFAGEDFRIHLVISNPRKRVPAFVLEARERSGPFGERGASAESKRLFWFIVEPGERRSHAFTVPGIPRRGVYPLEGFVLTTRFPFGFTEQRASADLPGEVIVFPTPRALTGEAGRALDVAQEVPRPRAFQTSPEEFRSLRDYRPRDNPRWIHWKSSARAGKLLVKEFEPRASRRAFLVVDAVVPEVKPVGKLEGKPGGKTGGRAARKAEAEAAAERKAREIEVLDRGCTLAVSVLEHLARQGERPDVAVLVKGEVVRFGPDMGPRETTSFLESLARLVPAEDPDLARLAEASRPGLRSGARLYLVTARDQGAVRSALERSEPGSAHRAQLMSYASAADAERLFAPADAKGGGRPRRAEAHG